jgi:hypothetical protein
MEEEDCFLPVVVVVVVEEEEEEEEEEEKEEEEEEEDKACEEECISDVSSLRYVILAILANFDFEERYAFRWDSTFCKLSRYSYPS